MKKVFTVLGVIFLILILVGGGCVIKTIHQGNQLDDESKNFIDTEMPKILTNWDFSEFQKYEDKNAMAKSNVSDEELQKVFTKYSELGKILEYKGSKGEALISNFNGRTYITATYVVEANFEKGPARIKLTLNKNDKWEIASIYVNSPAFK